MQCNARKVAVDTDIAQPTGLFPGSHASRPTPGRSIALIVSNEPEENAVVVQGSLGGTALHQLGEALARVMRSQERRFILDVRAVDHWSLVAQAMILATARKKAARGGQLVLRGVSAALREESRRLDLIARIVTVDTNRARRSSPRGHMGAPPAAGGLAQPVPPVAR